MADSHDTEQNILDKAKEINQKIKEKQAKSQANISSEISKEEPLPLNDPFVGDSSLTGGAILTNDPKEAKKFKLLDTVEYTASNGTTWTANSGSEIDGASIFQRQSITGKA